MAAAMTWTNSSNRSRRRAEQLAAFLGLVAAAAELSPAGPTAAVAQPAAYRPAADVPASWRDFAAQLQAKLQARLGADTKATGKIADAMTQHGSAADPAAAAQAITVRVWVAPDGKIARVACDDVAGDAATALRALLGAGEAGLPPPDMLQPVHLRLSLRAKPEPERHQ